MGRMAALRFAGSDGAGGDVSRFSGPATVIRGASPASINWCVPCRPVLAACAGDGAFRRSDATCGFS